MKMTHQPNDSSGQTVTPHPAPRIWVIVADRHQARIFSKPNGLLEEISVIAPEKTENPKGTPDDSLGRIVSSAACNVHHKLEPRLTPEEKESSSFARDLAHWLDRALQDKSFDRLVLAATPHLLGDLRKSLSKAVHSHIVAEINKDLTKMNDKKLYEELERIVWF
ncbi:MAG: host attachment protein [Pseudobdellovibrionaceae bacterium]